MCLIPKSTSGKHKTTYIILCYIHHTHQPVFVKKEIMSWKLLFFSKFKDESKSRLKFMTSFSSSQVFSLHWPISLLFILGIKEKNLWAGEIVLWVKEHLCNPGDLSSVPRAHMKVERTDAAKLSDNLHINVVVCVPTQTHIHSPPPTTF